MNDKQSGEPAITFRTPKAEDGAAVYQLVANCPPLDTNSMYCNLLQCSHFGATSVAAVSSNDEIVGFVSGYLIPGNEDTLFIWQVAVGEAARGRGLASKMLKEILARPQCKKVTHIHTTITPDNRASWALFESLANKLHTQIQSSVMFDREQHFAGQHETEMLVNLGPFKHSDIQ